MRGRRIEAARVRRSKPKSTSQASCFFLHHQPSLSPSASPRGITSIVKHPTNTRVYTALPSCLRIERSDKVFAAGHTTILTWCSIGFSLIRNQYSSDILHGPSYNRRSLSFLVFSAYRPQVLSSYKI
ncbi:hypothetical protein BO94DRAFT_243088 [Aspergillus sclerotioniger CBS 115572]|uniref:Uncharacterized protein n=1 Tax=Aspergillus sclerotioniger CBS 115572 TaxID=1450535 RepID=A0A317VFM9_9EURO|nr:hypothetical protein BO94DRAFT_243088 [Aspergillus sclerotioniger CBS 115572]PWY73193.1 hypothetical protein BO94DRAFT_243088 [Aspergillus sclerotioniger CBS 115572]